MALRCYALNDAVVCYCQSAEKQMEVYPSLSRGRSRSTAGCSAAVAFALTECAGAVSVRVSFAICSKEVVIMVRTLVELMMTSCDGGAGARASLCQAIFSV